MRPNRLMMMALAASMSSATLLAQSTGKTLDAVVDWGNGKACFFKRPQYLRWAIKADRVAAGYPIPIDNKTWPGIQGLVR